MMDSVKQIIVDLCNDGKKMQIADDSKMEYANRILAVFESSDYNIRSQIAENSKCITDPEIAHAVLQILDEIKQHVICKDEWDKNKIHAIGYFIDHLALEAHRLSRDVQARQEYRHYIRTELNEIMITVERQQQKMNEDVDEHKAQVAKDIDDRIRDSVKSLDIQAVTVLGIFSAVVFAFSGGITLLGSALTGIQNISIPTSFLLISALGLVGIVLLDCLYMLLYFIARIVGIEKWIRCDETCDSCKKCKDCSQYDECNAQDTKKFWRQFKHRHIAIMTFNTVLVILVVITLVIYWLTAFFSNDKENNSESIANAMATTNPVVTTVPTNIPNAITTINPIVSVMPTDTPSTIATVDIDLHNTPGGADKKSDQLQTIPAPDEGK